MFTKNFTRKDLLDWANKMIGENLFTSNDDDQPLLKAAADVLYLNSTWEMPFEPEMTEERIFFSSQKRQESFMNGEFEIPYLKSDQAQFVSLPLKNSCRISMVIPYGDWTIDKIFEDGDLCASLFESAQTLDEQDPWSVILSIPKMEFYATLDTNQTERIASQAGYSAMGQNGASWTVDQQAYFKMDEKGVKAASLTTGAATSSYTEMQKVKVDFNRPFLFFIYSDEGLPLFAGRYE